MQSSNIEMQRRGAANKSLLIALAVVAVVAVIFWMTKGGGDSGQAAFVPDQPVPLMCRACNKTTVVQPAEFAKLKVDKKTSSYECPACHELRAKISAMPESNAPPADGGRVSPEKP